MESRQASSRRYYLKNKEKIKARNKDYYESNKEQVIAVNKRHRKTNKKKLTRKRLIKYWKSSDKHRESTRQWRQKNPEHAAQLDAAKIDKRNNLRKRCVEFAGGKCQICGLIDHPIAFDFHHVDKSQKLFSISIACRKSERQLWDEVKKCVLLCAICHRKLEADLLSFSFSQNGSGSWRACLTSDQVSLSTMSDRLGGA